MSAKRIGKVVVVTGASAGIGRAAVRRFAKEGHDVALIARGQDGLEAAAAEVEHAGCKALIVPCDVSDADAVEGAAARAESELGPIDVWINNAMVSVFSPIKEMEPREFQRVTEVTYLGYVYGTLAALKRMLPRDRGTIVQVGSALAYRSIPLQSAYCAAKHAVVGFTDALRCELIHDGRRVHVTVVHMPAVNTPQFAWVKSRLPNKPQPVPPIYQPEVAADAIFFASERRRREIWVGGPTVKAIVADKVVPGLLDRFLARNGYDSQQTEESVGPNRRDNLWRPVDSDGGGDFGAHGSFDKRAADFSPAFELSKAKPWLVGGAAVCAGALAVAGAIYASRNGNPAAHS
jgi:NAD(P)-dependent dehydrogenase (short-subunit alcohol dehydrogenase family)